MYVENFYLIFFNAEKINKMHLIYFFYIFIEKKDTSCFFYINFLLNKINYVFIKMFLGE